MTETIAFVQSNWLNLLAVVWFIFCFKGYMAYARYRSYTTACLASVMHLYRTEWMRSLLSRDVRIADNAAIANLERGVAFLASTTILILAGLLTVLTQTDKAITLVDDLPFTMPASKQEWEFKLLVLLVLFVYAFFKFTWSFRQYGFLSVMIGAAPTPSQQPLDEQAINAHATRMARMASIAASNFNIGLRAYYFSLAVLGWLINPWLFILLSAGVVYVLYRREFASSTLKTLMMSTKI